VVELDAGTPLEHAIIFCRFKEHWLMVVSLVGTLYGGRSTALA